MSARCRGTMVVEAAIVFPLLLMLTLGAIEYGWFLINAQKITNAARQGARVAAAFDANQYDGEDEIQRLLTDGPPATYVVDMPDPNTVRATVTVNPTDVAIVNAPLLFPLPKALKAVVVMAKEG